MKKRGQIFLIMTILVISFIISISFVLFDVQRSNFTDPAPDADLALQSWEITYDSIVQIMEIELSQATVNGDLSGVRDITIPLSNLLSYLTDRGITASIVASSTIDYTSDETTPTDTLYSITGSFDIILETGTTSIVQSVTISLAYNAFSNANTITITRLLNSAFSFVNGASFTGPSTVVSNNDGSYQAGAAGLYTATTPNNILLSITTV